MSIHAYIRAKIGGDWDTSIPELSKETVSALPGKAFKVKADDTTITFDFTDTLTAGEVTTLDGVVSSHKAAGPYSRSIKPLGSQLVYGELDVTDGVTTQTTNLTPDTFDVITGFNTAQGLNGLSLGTTPNKTQNKITLDTAGKYLVTLVCCFDGKENATFTLRAFVEGVAQPQVSIKHKQSSTGGVVSTCANGIVNAAAGDDLDCRVKSDIASSDFTPCEMTLSAVRIGE